MGFSEIKFWAGDLTSCISESVNGDGFSSYGYSIFRGKDELVRSRGCRHVGDARHHVELAVARLQREDA